ncbi:MAG: VanZ family protein [Oscillospiraceae bacterium]|nr:VanZ family protein [Oscillospiraceae bacterium]
MIDLLNTILKNVLTALYQPFWYAVLLSILFMFFYLYAKEHGWKESIRIWTSRFKASSYFRRIFLLAFYTTMILFRTLLNRDMWMNPLSDVMGGWWLWEDGELTTGPIENLILFIPFTVLLLWAIGSNADLKGKFLKDMKVTTVLWQSTKVTFIFSVSIEFLQLFLRLGTWQLSDMFYNTLGGFLGGLIYWIGWSVKHCGDEPPLYTKI